MWRSHRRRFRNAFCGATPGARGSEVADDTTRRSSSIDEVVHIPVAAQRQAPTTANEKGHLSQLEIDLVVQHAERYRDEDEDEGDKIDAKTC